jgi:hypothetical protein
MVVRVKSESLLGVHYRVLRDSCVLFQLSTRHAFRREEVKLGEISLA